MYKRQLPYGDVFNYQLSDEENVRNILQKVHSDLNALSDKVKAKVTDKIIINPQGSIGWHGAGMQPVFFKNLVSKLGLEVQVFRGEVCGYPADM